MLLKQTSLSLKQMQILAILSGQQMQLLMLLVLTKLHLQQLQAVDVIILECQLLVILLLAERSYGREMLVDIRELLL